MEIIKRGLCSAVDKTDRMIMMTIALKTMANSVANFKNFDANLK